MRKFLLNQAGNVAVVAGIALLPITVLAGSAIDVASVIAERSRIQHALDIAALDTAQRISDDPSFADSKARVIAAAASTFHANYPNSSLDGTTITTLDGRVKIDLDETLSRNGQVVREIALTANAGHATSFMKIMIGDKGIKTKTVAAAVVRNDSFDVVMVLDNSGSMGGSRIRTLRTAASDLSTILLGMNEGKGNRNRVQVGLVPFSTYVNVGAGNRRARWLDQKGLSPIHSENFDQPANRFDLFDKIPGISWSGCVEARPAPYDVTDAAPDRSTPATLIVPVFAPDEPDPDNANGMRYANDYLEDQKASVSGKKSKKSKSSKKSKKRKKAKKVKKLKTATVAPLCERAPAGAGRPAASQARICKYEGAVPSAKARASNGVSAGPNFNCRSQPIQPLTTDRNTLMSAIASMKADGFTNIHQGVMWGWRTLSKAEPFTESREDKKFDHNKVMIIMTDGDNYYGFSNANHNKSAYGAYGFAAVNRIGANPLSASEWLDRSNLKTAEACRNAKADAGILIYSIAFKLDNKTTLDMMKTCASRPDMFFASNSNDELRKAFEDIAESISKLRLSR